MSRSLSALVPFKERGRHGTIAQHPVEFGRPSTCLLTKSPSFIAGSEQYHPEESNRFLYCHVLIFFFALPLHGATTVPEIRNYMSTGLVGVGVSSRNITRVHAVVSLDGRGVLWMKGSGGSL